MRHILLLLLAVLAVVAEKRQTSVIKLKKSPKFAPRQEICQRSEQSSYPHNYGQSCGKYVKANGRFFNFVL